MSDSAEPVIVFESAQPMEIAMGTQLLEEAGIPFAVDGPGNSSVMSALGGAPFAGVQVIEVPAEFAERAQAVLEKAWGTEEGGASGS